MFGKTMLAFSTLLAITSAGGYGHDTAAVAVKQDTHAFSYKVQEANHRAYVAPAVVHQGYGHAYGHGYGYAHAVPAVVANTVGYAAAPVVAKTVGYAAAPVVAHHAGYQHHGGYYNDYAPKPYAFGYSYGAASPAYSHAYGYQHGHHHGYAAPHHY